MAQSNNTVYSWLESDDDSGIGKKEKNRKKQGGKHEKERGSMKNGMVKQNIGKNANVKSIMTEKLNFDLEDGKQTTGSSMGNFGT